MLKMEGRYVLIALLLILILLLFLSSRPIEVYGEEERRREWEEKKLEYFRRVVGDVCSICKYKYRIQVYIDKTGNTHSISRNRKYSTEEWERRKKDKRHKRKEDASKKIRGSIYILLYRDNIPFDTNTLTYALIHEIAHLICPTIGHDSHFRTIETKLLSAAASLSYYRKDLPLDPLYPCKS